TLYCSHTTTLLVLRERPAPTAGPGNHTTPLPLAEATFPHLVVELIPFLHGQVLLPTPTMRVCHIHPHRRVVEVAGYPHLTSVAAHPTPQCRLYVAIDRLHCSTPSP